MRRCIGFEDSNGEPIREGDTVLLNLKMPKLLLDTSKSYKVIWSEKDGYFGIEYQNCCFRINNSPSLYTIVGN